MNNDQQHPRALGQREHSKENPLGFLPGENATQDAKMTSPLSGLALKQSKPHLTRATMMFPEMDDSQLAAAMNADYVPANEAVMYRAAVTQRLEWLSHELDAEQHQHAMTKHQVERWNQIAEGETTADTCGGHMTHEQVAWHVYCTERNSLDFQGRIQTARDRIVWLAARLFKIENLLGPLQRENIELRREIKKLKARKTVYS